MFATLTGNFQTEVLRSVKRLENNAYGMKIRDNLMDLLPNREIHMSQVYAALSRLEKLGLVTSNLDDKNSAGRRGRTRRVYQLSAHGLQLLSDGVRDSHGAGLRSPANYVEEAKAATA